MMHTAEITISMVLIWLISAKCRTTAEGAVTPEGCDSNVDLLFIIDSSESILDADPVNKDGLTWIQLKNFTKGLATRLPVGSNTSVAAIRFGSRADIVFTLNQHRNTLGVADALMSMRQMGGNTNTAAAFRKARLQIFNGDYGARAYARNVVVFLGDGIANKEVQYTDREVRLVKDPSGSGAEVFAVGISTEILQTELRKMSSFPTDKHYLHAPSLDDLPHIQEILLHRICRLPDPVIPTKEPNCGLPGCEICDDTKCFACLDGKYLLSGKCEDCIANCQLCSDAVTCERCIRGWYWEPETSKCEECQLIADMALVIDNSGSIRDKNPEDKSYDNYHLLKEFVTKLLDRVDIGPNATRVGAIKFSSMSQLVFQLNAYEQRDVIKQAILNMGYSGGHTNISGGLRMMREQLFTGLAGDRPDVGNIGLVITDGESTIDKNLTDIEAELAKQSGITLFVVGVTDEINEEELKNIASKPVDDHYFNSTDIRTLDELLHSLTIQVCAQKPLMP